MGTAETTPGAEDVGEQVASGAEMAVEPAQDHVSQEQQERNDEEVEMA